MVSIIEGIAGNDIDIVESYDHIKDFTAQVAYGKTGVGLLEVGKEGLRYRHFVSGEELEVRD
jgi:hypothetical protein